VLLANAAGQCSWPVVLRVLARDAGQWCCPVVLSSSHWPTWQVYCAACTLMHAHVRIYVEFIIPMTIIPINYHHHHNHNRNQHHNHYRHRRHYHHQQKGNPKRLAKSVAQKLSSYVPPATKLVAQRLQIPEKTWSQNWDQNLVPGIAFRSERPETGSKSRTGIDCENPAGLKTARSVLGSICSATWHNERSAQQEPNVPLHSCAPC
jgi:hypothetical protein